MNLRRKLAAGLAATGLLLTAGLAAAPAASASTTPPGTNSLAKLLGVGSSSFDRNPYDFDIVTKAAEAVLAKKPNSPVGLLANGTVALTAFVPNDRAFQLLVGDLTGKYYGFYTFDEAKVFNAVASLGIDAVEKVLLYHVVPGKTITAKTALGADGAVLPTALPGASITVDVRSTFFKLIELKDLDPDDRNPFVVRSKFDLNAGNLQIAHGISRVLRPSDM